MCPQQFGAGMPARAVFAMLCRDKRSTFRVGLWKTSLFENSCYFSRRTLIVSCFRMFLPASTIVMNFKLLCGVEAVALVIGVGYICILFRQWSCSHCNSFCYLPYCVSYCVHGLYFYELLPHFAFERLTIVNLDKAWCES